MRILLADAGIVPGHGHNQAMLQELDAEAQEQSDHSEPTTLICAVAQGTDPHAFPGIRCTIRPTFRLHGYARLACDGQPRQAVADALLAICIEDWQTLPLREVELVLMPTAHPFHLLAMATLLDRWPQLRIAGGLLLPPRFWAKDDDAVAMLEAAMLAAIDKLAGRADALLYSETGRYRVGDVIVQAPPLLPPASSATLQWMAELAARPRVGSGIGGSALRFGFFGEPEPRKGFDHLAAVIAQGVPHDVALTLRLPAQWHAVPTAWASLAPQVDAVAETTDNRAFLAGMASVDVVLAFYAPEVHREQMSGIVAEAICLGKPLLLAEGCDALIDFLDEHAPGSYLCRPWSVDGLGSGLAAPREQWEAAAQAAMAAAPAMRARKSADRYLANANGQADRHG